MSLLALFLVMIALAVVPSTSVALVVTRSATRGFQSGAAAAAGIVVGDLIFLGLAMLGMAALAHSLGSIFCWGENRGRYVLDFSGDHAHPAPAAVEDSYINGHCFSGY